jgi:pyruvate dehydrogenase E1 component alpha subunit
MVNAIGPKVLNCDGNNVLQAYDTINKAIMETKKGKGPFFLEFSTYRWLEHCGPNYDNNIGYRTQKEFIKWKKKDPILRLKKKIDPKFHNKLIKIENKVKIEINNAFKFAEKSPFPNEAEAYKGVYA